LDLRGRKWWEAVENCIMRSFITCMLHEILLYIIMMVKSRMIWVGHVVHMVLIMNAYKILVRKPEGKRPFRRHRCRWEDNIKMDLRKMACEDLDWIHLFHCRNQLWGLVNIVMNLSVP
jgi:hypothetical protein